MMRDTITRDPLAGVKAALEECRDYFDGRSDADLDGDNYTPNDEMLLRVECEVALKLLKEVREGMPA